MLEGNIFTDVIPVPTHRATVKWLFSQLLLEQAVLKQIGLDGRHQVKFVYLLTNPKLFLAISDFFRLKPSNPKLAETEIAGSKVLAHCGLPFTDDRFLLASDLGPNKKGAPRPGTLQYRNFTGPILEIILEGLPECYWGIVEI